MIYNNLIFNTFVIPVYEGLAAIRSSTDPILFLFMGAFIWRPLKFKSVDAPILVLYYPAKPFQSMLNLSCAKITEVILYYHFLHSSQ